MWEVAITIEDGEKHKATQLLHLPSGATYAQASAAADGLAALVLGLTTGRITNVSLSQARPLPAGNPAVGAGVGDVELKGAFSFLTSGNHVYRTSVPAFDKATFVPDDTDEIDQSLAPVSDFIDAMIAGVDVSGTMIQPTDSRAEDVAALISALEAYGKKRKKGARG